jgi:chitinase
VNYSEVWCIISIPRVVSEFRIDCLDMDLDSRGPWRDNQKIIALKQNYLSYDMNDDDGAVLVIICT